MVYTRNTSCYAHGERKNKYEMKICTSKYRKVFAKSRVEYVIEWPKFLNVHNVFKLQAFFALLLLPNRPRLDCRVSVYPALFLVGGANV